MRKVFSSQIWGSVHDFFKIKSLRPKALSAGVLLASAAALPSLGHAAIVTFNFSYSGVNNSLPNATSSGSGSFTVDYTGLGPQPPSSLTAFSFLLTLTTNGPTSESSTFSYSLPNVNVSPSVILTGTVANPLPAQLDVVTTAVAGTDPAFGPVAADLNMGLTGGTILTQNYSSLGDTGGQAVWTSVVTAPVAAAPEPSVFGLLALAGVFGVSLGSRLRRTAEPTL